MELAVLGTAASYPGGGLACSGYLVTDGPHTLLLDVGAGSLANIPPSFELGRIDALLISHMHPDHYSDIFVLAIYLEFFSGRASPLPLYAPPGSAAKLGMLPWDSPKGFDGNFAFTPWTDGGRFEIGPFVVFTARTSHIEPTFALRIENQADSSITYSADTGVCASVEGLARGTDLLLAEATWLDPPSADGVGHLTAQQAGTLARRTGARQLVLTHLSRAVDHDEALERARQAFGGPVTVAKVGQTYRVNS